MVFESSENFPNRQLGRVPNEFSWRGHPGPRFALSARRRILAGEDEADYDAPAIELDDE